MYPYTLFLDINLYTIALSLAIILALLLCDKLTQVRGFSVALQKLVIVAILFAVTLGIGSATLFQGLYDFLKTGVFKLDSNTGMTFLGGLIGGTIIYLSVWFIGGKLLLKGNNQKEERNKFKDMLDIAACCIPLAHAIGRLGCFFAGCCHGKETDAWYGVNMYTENGWKTVVPVQLFESIFLFILAALLLCLFFKKPNKLPLMPIYCGVYCVWRFFIEYARADDRGASFLSFLSPSQLTSLLLIVIAIIYLVIWFLLKNKSKKL